MRARAVLQREVAVSARLRDRVGARGQLGDEGFAIRVSAQRRGQEFYREGVHPAQRYQQRLVRGEPP